jgi:hypothetical protein
MRTLGSQLENQGSTQVNLSERLAKAAMERRRQPEGSAQQVDVATMEPQSTSAFLPDRTPEPISTGRVVAMKMRLPEPTSPETTIDSNEGLPLWQRPFVDVLRDAGLATVTTLPIQPRENEAIEEDLDDVELAQTIPMPGVRMHDADLDDLHVPPLGTSESTGLASASLSSESGHHIDHDHPYSSDQMSIVNLDDVTIDAEIVLDGSSADALLDRWSEDVSADVHHRQERVDGLYQRMVDAEQYPRVTFGPIDLRDEIVLDHAEGPAPLFRSEVATEVAAPLPRVDDEHTCPQCGAKANLDIHDPMRGRIHLSCDSCFKMWQVRVESTVHSDEPFMRD